MRSIFYYTLVLLLFIFVISCNPKDESEFIGPALCPTANFKVNTFEIASEQMDFNSSVYEAITASFSEEATWKIELKGVKSGAVKTYNGRSSTVNLKWYGESAKPEKFFQSNEAVTVTLSFSCIDLKYTKSIDIINASRFVAEDAPYLLVSDFEGNGCVKAETKMNKYVKGGWSSYTELGDIKSISIHSSNEHLPAPQGSNFITLTGKAKPNSWFVGGTYIELPYSYTISSSDNTYLSAYISSGSNSTTTLGIAIKMGALKMYKYALPINWRGWKMVQLRLEDFKDSNGKSLDQLSDGTITIDFGLNCSNQTGQETEVNLDFVVLSKNGPFFQ